jgi:uncharacterized membrane protein YdfJ with MMPL/SSD domain
VSENPPAEARSFTARISMWSARHRRPVVLAWFLVLILALGACSVVEADTDIEMEAPGETGQASALIKDRLGEEEDIPTEFVVFSHPSLTVDAPAYKETVEGLVAKLRDLRATETEIVGGTTVTSSTRVVADIMTHYDIGLPGELSPFVQRARTPVMSPSPSSSSRAS